MKVLLHTLIAALVPPLLVLTGVQLVMTEAFLRLEYHRPGFPADRFGFTTGERLRYAPYAVRYLRNDAGIDYLGRLTFADGTLLFERNELDHMADVKVVSRAALRVHVALSLLAVALVVLLARRRETRPILLRGLARGGVLTITLMLTLAVLVIASWDVFFTGFHRLFFEGDSWQFSTSDTLIRLFPEQFWFDAAVSIGAFTLLGAVIAVVGAALAETRLARTPEPASQRPALDD